MMTAVGTVSERTPLFVLFVALAATTIFGRAAEGTAMGAIKLDNYTFDKMVGIPGFSLLVKFDQSYAYGDKEDEFKELCKISHSVKSFLVAEVPVQEYGDKENDDLREDFGLKKDDFPAYFLFTDKGKEGSATTKSKKESAVRYSGAVTAADLGAWLRKFKIPVPAIGTIAEMDALAKKFLKDGLENSGNYPESVIVEAQKLAEGEYSADKKAPVYVKIMQKIKEKGEAYVASESARVAKIMDGKMAEDKKAEMNDKLKILGQFSKDEL